MEKTERRAEVTEDAGTGAGVDQGVETEGEGRVGRGVDQGPEAEAAIKSREIVGAEIGEIAIDEGAGMKTRTAVSGSVQTRSQTLTKENERMRQEQAEAHMERERAMSKQQRGSQQASTMERKTIQKEWSDR